MLQSGLDHPHHALCPMPKSILIINTGGTISCINTARGYEPSPDGVAAMLKQIPALSHPDMPHYDIKEYQPLLDSSNVTWVEWNKLAKDIADHYHAYDGFVIFHGTDTMAYTASALSFMLEHLNKPVILTGSQLPLSEIRNDAMDNVITSLWLAAHSPLTEVCVYFSQTLMRGNRARKMSSSQFNAFQSPNFPPLANIGTAITLRHDLLWHATDNPFHFQAMSAHRIANFRLFPGFSVSTLQHMLQQQLDGLILETYGTGNAPNHDMAFLDTLDQGSKKTLIVNCSQCPHGAVAMDQYATGSALKRAGLISGHDMTPEAVHAKLMYLFSKYNNIDDIKQRMQDNLVGELSITPKTDAPVLYE